MKKLLPPGDFVEAMGEAYELLLENALKKARQSGTAVHQMIAAVRGDSRRSDHGRAESIKATGGKHRLS